VQCVDANHHALTRERSPMFDKLTLRTWICNAAAVFSGRHGAITEQAHEAGCSRQTVYVQAHQLEERLPALEAELQRLWTENQALRQQRATAEAAPGVDRSWLPRFAVTAQAMGISLRQSEELLGTLLPAAQVPDHATLGRWTAAAARQAGAVLAVLDPLCTPLVETLCVDEIFLGG
jgi:hypothetical protein